MVGSFVLSVFQMYHLTPSGPLLFLIRSQLLILLGFFYIQWVIFIYCFVFFTIFTKMHLGVGLLMVILHGIHWISWIFRLFFIKFGKFSAIIYSNIFLWFFLLTFRYSHYTYVSMLNGNPLSSEALFINFFPFIFFRLHIL